jgi:2-C-methyl-D-erythritol 4-phosphate cytidylyltransferase
MAPPNLGAVIVAAGSSRRMGFDKLTAQLLGKPLIVHSLDAFQRCADVDGIVLVCGSERAEDFTKLAAEFSKVRAVVPGGRERVDSVLRGLEGFPSPEPIFVAVHDGARPLITPEAISICYHQAVEFGAAVCAEPETDTLHRVDADQCTMENVSRKNLWRMQTPQITEFNLLISLIRKMEEEGTPATDEISVLMRSGGRARVVETPDWNFKVTYPRDLQLAERVMKGRTK